MNRLVSKAASGCLLAISASVAYSGAMGPEAIGPPVRIYVGAFGGGGTLSSVDISQYGTSFFTEAVGGPLAVDAFGSTDSRSFGMVGGHIGFAWPNATGTYLPITPALELEGYYLSARLEGHDVSNDTTRLPEHDFLVTYPTKSGVFLLNAVLNANNSLFGKFSPYVGVGMGSALVSISGASSIQIRPAESGINHYNSNTNDTAFAFAAQPKVGVRFDFYPRTSIFVEYRFLYVSKTSYTFGSTVFPGHTTTSPWLGNIKSQYYNMGTAGINFDL